MLLSKNVEPKIDIEVFRFNAAKPLDGAIDCLSVIERERAFAIDSLERRTEFVQSRAQVRRILAKKMKVEPSTIEFKLGPYGKPHLVNDSESSWYFNMSHSQNQRVIAVSSSFEVGADLEVRRANIKMEEIATRLFSATNQKLLSDLSGDEKINFFFKLWTFHEAYLKALGESVFAAPSIAHLITFDDISDSEIRGDDFRILELEFSQGYASALAIIGLSHSADIRVHYIDL